MAQWHLDELRAALERRGWRLTAELPGNDRDISATWTLSRSGGKTTELLLDFDGLDDMKTLPISESYACAARGTGKSLYFRRRGEKGTPTRERWREELGAFVAEIGGDHAV
jgi:hypothetical protein